MSGVTVKKKVRRTFKMLDKYKNAYKNKEIYNVVGNLGVEVANNEYNQTGVKPDAIRYENISNGVEIVAEGEHLAFVEYGTGVKGEGTYDGDLPKNTLKFHSNGADRETQGWVYDYMKKLYDGKESYQGNIAKAQMWKTARTLQGKMPESVKKEIKRG